MRSLTIFVAGALFATPVQLIAQNVLQTGEETVEDGQRESDDEGNSRLGLLGLLGLAGLLGLIRREPDIHVDARRGGDADARGEERR